MSDSGYKLLLPDDISEKIDEFDQELEFLSPKQKEFLLLWLRDKSRRAKLKGEANEQALFMGTELVDLLTKTIQDEIFPDFNRQYMEYLYRSCKIDQFGSQSHTMLSEYLDEKRLLYEIGLLSEHLFSDEITRTIENVLKEEPRNEWYEELTAVCEESVAIRKCFATYFGVAENEVFPVGGTFEPEPKTVNYMILAEGAEPEAVMFIKKITDRKSGKLVYVFCHENPADDNKLEYFTVSNSEGAQVAISKGSSNESNSDRFTLWVKEMSDFSDDVYLEKPDVSTIAERYDKMHISNPKEFEKRLQSIIVKMKENKTWCFGRGKNGELISEAPAYAKMKAFRMQAIQYEMTGSYKMSLKKLVELMQEEVRDQQDLIENIFNAMRMYAEAELAQAQAKGQGNVNERDAQRSSLKPEQKQQEMGER